MRQIFLDTETTGLSAETGDRLIEIGCIEMVNRRITGNHLAAAAGKAALSSSPRIEDNPGRAQCRQ